jgi:hypothetical protein
MSSCREATECIKAVGETRRPFFHIGVSTKPPGLLSDALTLVLVSQVGGLHLGIVLQGGGGILEDDFTRLQHIAK